MPDHGIYKSIHYLSYSKHTFYVNVYRSKIRHEITFVISDKDRKRKPAMLDDDYELLQGEVKI